jgi:hypothetical protein
MKSRYLLFSLLLLLTSCSSVIYTYDRTTGKWSVEHFTSWGGDPDLLNQIDDDVKGESENAPLLYGTWREYWIDRCERFHYYENPVLAEHYFEYIINKRREAGLPDIPEIDKRQFRPLWENWTSSIDEELALEAKGGAPLSVYDVKLRIMTKTWPEYWEAEEEGWLNDHLDIDSIIHTNGVEHINNRRREMGLTPVE